MDLDFTLSLSLKMKGAGDMSDDWIEKKVRQIKTMDEDRRRHERLELLRADKISSHESSMWKELVKSTKATVEKFNAHFPHDTSKRFTIENERYDRIDIVSGMDVSLCLSVNEELHGVDFDLWKENKKLKEGVVVLDVNETGDVRYIVADRPVSIEKLSEILLDELVAFYLVP